MAATEGLGTRSNAGCSGAGGARVSGGVRAGERRVGWESLLTPSNTEHTTALSLGHWGKSGGVVQMLCSGFMSVLVQLVYVICLCYVTLRYVVQLVLVSPR